MDREVQQVSHRCVCWCIWRYLSRIETKTRNITILKTETGRWSWFGFNCNTCFRLPFHSKRRISKYKYEKMMSEQYVRGCMSGLENFRALVYTRGQKFGPEWINVICLALKGFFNNESLGNVLWRYNAQRSVYFSIKRSSCSSLSQFRRYKIFSFASSFRIRVIS